MDSNLKMSSGSSSPTSSSRKGRKKSNINTNNDPEKPKPPQRGLGVAQLERLRLQDQLISNYLNHIAPFHNDNSSNHLLPHTNQGNQWNLQTGKSSRPSFTYLSSSTSPSSEYQPNKMMKFGVLERANTNQHLGATSKSNHSVCISNVVTMPLQNQQGEKDCIQKKRNADWLTLSIGSSGRPESEAVLEYQEVDLELKL